MRHVRVCLFRAAGIVRSVRFAEPNTAALTTRKAVSSLECKYLQSDGGRTDHPSLIRRQTEPGGPAGCEIDRGE